MKKHKGTSFVNNLSLKLCGKNDFTSRSLMAITTGQIAGKLFGPFLPWGIVIYDGLVRKKESSLKNFGDYVLFKASATLMNPEEMQYVSNFIQEKYQLIEPHINNFLTNNL